MISNGVSTALRGMDIFIYLFICNILFQGELGLPVELNLLKYKFLPNSFWRHPLDSSQLGHGFDFLTK